MFLGEMLFALTAALLLTAIWANSFRKNGVWVLRWMLLTAGLLVSRTAMNAGLADVTSSLLPRFNLFLPWLGLAVALAVLVPVDLPRTALERLARVRAETMVNRALAALFWVVSSVLFVVLAGQWLV